MKGFTLIEIIVVMAIILIVGLSSTVFIGFYKGIKLDGAANKLVSDIQYAQSLAMSSTTWYGVSFEVSPTNKYTVYSTTGTIDSAASDPAKLQSALIVNLADFDSTISAVLISGGGNHVEFSPLGQPFTDKTGAPLSAEAVITLVSGSYTKTVRITPNTGKVTIQ